MIISSLHWFVATVVAVAVHLAGILWLSLASPERRIVAETAGEGIVVTLGREARSAARSATQLDPEDSRSVDTVSEANPARPQAAVDEALPETPDTEAPAPAEAEQQSARLADLEAATAAESPEPQPAAASELVNAPAAEPEPAATPDTAGAVESAQVAAAPAQEDSAVSVQVPDAAPESTDAVAVQEAAQPDPSRDAAEPPDAASPPVAEPALQPNEPVPTVAAGDTPAVEPSETPAAAREVESPTTSAADVEAAESARSSPELQLTAVEPEAGPEQPVDVATARQPAPEVQQSFEPEVSEAAQPETVNLQELQERSGGTGVVARYAGVLKGWLQRNMHYPRAARLAGQEGDVVVRFIIDRQGNVQSVELESGSGFELLDREATEMVERGDPFPPMPEDMAGERLEVRVPVSFHVRDETRNKDLPPIYLE